jgi:uroporphyrinogen-III decarboxylase
MLTKRQNFLETIRGGNPDRFVNQYEYLTMLMGVDPIGRAYPRPSPGSETVDGWGVTIRWEPGQPGPFPVHDIEHKVIKDITKWKDVIKSPKTDYPDEAWEDARKASESVDRKETYVTACYFGGIFEKLHFLMGMDDCLLNFYEEPDAMHELIEYITNYELAWGAGIVKHVKPDALFHHDDWGSQKSTFMSPAMFDEFILPSYKKIYGFFKKNDVEIIVHHCDSYAATIVPQMIEMGIDVFQGCLTSNNVPELVRKYGGKIAFMGDLNNGVLDKADWTPELIRTEVERACRTNGKRYFIPCLAQGLPIATFPGVYDAVTAEIDRMSAEMFN